MSALSTTRPVFHSEADFQLALAWQILSLHPQARIRLERRVLWQPTVALDVLIVLAEQTFALELKYLKANLQLELDGEPFDLRAGAGDVERYDVLRDLVRLERVVNEEVANAGCALVLSNAASFWTGSPSRITGYDAFRIHEGRVLTGNLAWGPTAGPGTRTNRETEIQLRGSYECRWQPYSRLPSARNGELRYLALVV